MLGETLAGPLCDRVAKRHLDRSRSGSSKPWKPESLLPLSLPGLVAISTGLLLYGLELGSSWQTALAGIAIFTAGQEIMMTVLMTYMADCYPDRAAEISVVFQFFLNAMAYSPPFYTPSWLRRAGGPTAPYVVFAILPVLVFPPTTGLLMWRGERIRARGPWFLL